MAPRTKRHKSVFTSALRQKYPFLSVVGNDESDIRCNICNSNFSISNSGKSQIKQHLNSKRHRSYEVSNVASRISPITTTSNSSTSSSVDDEPCLICHSNNSNYSKVSVNGSMCSSIAEFSVLEQNLQVYFILKKVLELSSRQLESYLMDCPELIECVKICADCNKNYVENCKKIYVELLQVQKKFNDAKAVLIDAIKMSFEDQYGTFNVCKEIRRFVKRRTYTDTHSESSPFDCGDILAKGKLQPLQEKYVDTLSSGNTYFIPFQEKVEHFETPLNGEAREEPELPCQVAMSDNLYDKFIGFHENDTGKASGEKDNSDDIDWEPNNLSESGQEDDVYPVETKKRAKSKIDIINKTVKKYKSQQQRRLSLNAVSLQTQNKLQRKTSTKELVKCNHCSKAYKSQKRLRNHVRHAHDINAAHECSKCSFKTDNRRRLRMHMKCHGNIAVTCSICHLILSSETVLKHHISRLHNDKREKHQCEHCGTVYLDKICLLNHMGSKHGVKDHLRFACSFDGCDKAYYKKSQLVEHELIHKTPTYECKICGAEYKTTKSYRRHMDLHKFGETKQFACELCPARYARHDNLFAHMRQRHNTNSADEGVTKRKWRERIGVKCSECGLAFAMRKLLDRHVEKMHNNKDNNVEKLSEPSQDSTVKINESTIF